jgi:hypothetical protein
MAEMDASLSEEDWHKVYQAYAKSGSPYQLAKATDLEMEQINHLLKRGLERLALPGIESFAVDQAEISARLGKYSLAATDDAALDPEKRAQQLEVREKITSRVAREAEAAQVLLEASYSLTGTMMTLLRKVRTKIDEGNISVPNEITASYLKVLSDSIEKMAKAVDISTRLSRLTAGEPESNFAAAIIHLVQQLSPSEMQALAETGRAPAILRGREAEADDALDVSFSRVDDE